jgi:hypothetical protein
MAPSAGEIVQVREGRKVFFSEEKKQKTFATLSRTCPAAFGP